ncbi:MAG: hypothetical protein M0P01_09675 [Treponema sp.]|nr:hypothetical protein [Treponema sp.]
MAYFAKFYGEEFSPAACLIRSLKKYIKGSFADCKCDRQEVITEDCVVIAAESNEF